MSFTPAQIASVCHEANRGLQRLLGEQVNFAWEATSPALKASAIDGVIEAQKGKSPQELHENWVAFKDAEGWTHGPEKDFAKKEHPCMVPYDELPPEQRVKDAVFQAVVQALSE